MPGTHHHLSLPLMQTIINADLARTAENLIKKKQGLIELTLSLLSTMMPLNDVIKAVSEQRMTTFRAIEHQLVEVLNMGNALYSGRWSEAPETLLALATAFGWTIEERKSHGKPDRINPVPFDAESQRADVEKLGPKSPNQRIYSDWLNPYGYSC